MTSRGEDSLLQMSVHSMPQTPSPQRVRRGRWQMILVLLVCAAPVIASYLMYYVVRPQGGRTNYGELVMPPRALPGEWQLQRLDGDGGTVPADALRGQWLLVTVQSGACDATCERALYVQRQLREMLGRDKDKLDRVWLVPDDQPVQPALLPAMAGGWVLKVDAGQLATWLTPGEGRTLAQDFFIVDPRGDWMMRTPVDGEPKRIHKDLARLIKAAESWDEAGR